uniref:Integrase, catalytic region, zinc finger, CCHC-type, peptidase aspartic, catalytic n=1 Tax=Tanacetum cinerariifolium TaxID=118510 RepID=A0A6L2NJ36_TANCI|nr:hypothetical protein [Tanacetum cinerariifolium]
MANLSEDIQYADTSTWPPSLDMTDFASWQQRIRLYYWGKENEVNILKSIDEGPFQMGTFQETLVEGKECAFHLGLPKDIYTLINHYTDAKDIWDNVKMLLEGSELTKEDQESQLFIKAVKLNKGLRDSNYDQLYAYLKQHEAHANENKMMLDRFTQHTVDPLALVSNVSHQQYYSQSSTTPPSIHVQPHFTDPTHHDSRLSPTDNLIENLTNILALLTQSYLKPTINSELHQTQGTKPLFKMAGLLFRMFRVDKTKVKGTMQGAQADECDAFDSDVDEAPTTHTMFMDAVCELHEVHEMHENVQPNCVVVLYAEYTTDSNMILYVKDNAKPVVQNNVSSVQHDVSMMIINEMHEQTTQHAFVKAHPKVDGNLKEENLKKELDSVKMQLNFTINHNKSMVEEVTSLKNNFQHKENKYLEEFLDMKALKEKRKVAIGYKKPLYLIRAKKVKPALYNGHEIIKSHHVSSIVHNSEDTLEIAKITRKKMNDKMKTTL